MTAQLDKRILKSLVRLGHILDRVAYQIVGTGGQVHSKDKFAAGLTQISASVTVKNCFLLTNHFGMFNKFIQIWIAAASIS